MISLKRSQNAQDIGKEVVLLVTEDAIKLPDSPLTSTGELFSAK